MVFHGHFSQIRATQDQSEARLLAYPDLDMASSKVQSAGHLLLLLVVVVVVVVVVVLMLSLLSLLSLSSLLFLAQAPVSVGSGTNPAQDFLGSWAPKGTDLLLETGCMSCDIHTHTPAQKSSTNFIL